MKIFSTQSLQLAKKSLDVYARQHESIAKNISNANTANYKRVDTDFSKLLTQDLNRSLKVTNEKHIQDSQTPDSRGLMDGGENVDVNREMGELAENQIRYDFAARVLARKYKGLSMSIIGRNS